MPSAAPTGRDAEALRSLARRIDPSDPGAQNNLGVFYYERGLIPDAIAAFTRALGSRARCSRNAPMRVS